MMANEAAPVAERIIGRSELRACVSSEIVIGGKHIDQMS
jgi:hypothetical protein